MLAITGLAQIAKTEEQKRQEFTRKAEWLIRRGRQGRTPETMEQAWQLLEKGWPYLDKQLRDGVEQLFDHLPAEPPDHGHPGPWPGTG